ncbi:MAG: methyltransferase domain-containing protein [Thiohalomonadaceae bacterium]
MHSCVRHRLWRARLGLFRLAHIAAPQFRCPICGYEGPFKHVRSGNTERKWAKCPGCGSLERHRILSLVLESVLADRDTRTMKMIHFAPEPFFRDRLASRFGSYETADYAMPDVDHRVNLQDLPFSSHSYDFVFCSHVLEHVPDDARALAEIRRILKPGGIALLPVPITSDVTVEYPAPNPHEHHHVRAPGADYYDRYDPFFARVERFSSDDFPGEFQLYLFEDRTVVPRTSPLRRPMPGNKHPEIVPVCYVE